MTNQHFYIEMLWNLGKVVINLTKLLVQAVIALSNIIKTSIGPKGLDTIIVYEIGDVTITNNGAKILK